MATKRMLVDAIHPEETRVVVTNGNRLEEFDFESAARQQLRGNIYLAKVTRVEPSLQAAFIEYGGNRHGFLAFSEIHPDYYQIPVADREALLREEEAEDEREAEAAASEPESVSEALSAGEGSDEGASAGDFESAPADVSDQDAEAESSGDGRGQVEDVPHQAENVESIGGNDTVEEEVPQRRRAPRRNYLPECSQEAAELLELSQNAERVGVQIDARTSERIKKLQSRLSGWLDALETDKSGTNNVVLQSKVRMLEAAVAAVKQEAALPVRD